MTSQSPRIYIYKITFDEVLYYYYGVHKEKYFNQEYWGSPVTHKWCLNENCGNIFSLTSCSKAGKIGGKINGNRAK